MKKFIIILLILLPSVLPHSQSGWTALNSNEKFPLIKIQAIDSQNVFACGLNGTLVRSTNGGGAWTGTAGGTSYSYHNLFFVDNTNTGYLIYYSDTIGTFFYKTTNSGVNWQLLYQNPDQWLESLFFISANTGWTGDGLGNIYYTTNGGASWGSTSIQVDFTNSLYFVNNLTGWAACFPYAIYKTTNSGINWVNQPLPSGSGALHSLYFINSLTGYCVGQNGVILYTTNSSTNWIRQQSGTVFDFNSVYFTSASTGWIVGEYGFVLYTTNGGTTWIRKTGFPKLSYESVYFLNPSTGYICGEFGAIYKTTTGGF